MKIAIVGSGISGMAVGHFLAPHHEVHLFEAAARIGGHTHTHEVTVPSGKYAVDTGFIVFNNRNYPNFIKLMDELKVDSKDSIMSFSVKSETNDLEYNGNNLNSLFCQRKNLFNPRFYKMVFDILRFNKEATKHYQTVKEEDEKRTLADYLTANNYSEEFIRYYILPMGAAIWSASLDEMKKFPFGFFVRFFHHHGLLTVDDRPQWRVLLGGSSSYIPKLTASYAKNIHLSSPVTSVTRGVDGVILESKGETFKFDQVIFACHGDQAMRILKNPTSVETSVMKNFSYRANETVLHTDHNVLPKKKLGHASWNYLLTKDSKDHMSVSLTYNMNILQGINSPETFLVSLNMTDRIDPKKILKVLNYSHPVYNEACVQSQKRWSEVSGVDRIHFCGAYWGNGFHEDGVKSAIKVAETLGVKC
jgi:predicted NAD/FAD-binding protein